MTGKATADLPGSPTAGGANGAAAVLVVDNYDSFTWNLVQMLGALGADPRVVRNDEVPVEELLHMTADRVVVSPGPGTPAEAGVTVELIRRLPPWVPVLGVCLGHQAIGEAFGGRTVPASSLMHGKAAPIRHEGRGLFEGIPSPCTVTRYHSLMTDPDRLPAVLVPEAWSDQPGEEQEVQAMRHRDRPVWGVQFHPESLFSDHGSTLVRNFLRLPVRDVGDAGDLPRGSE